MKINRALCMFCLFGSLTLNAWPERQNSDFSIHNFKAGYACAEALVERPFLMSPEQICFQSKVINVTGQGQCIYGGEWKSCTWHGFEFSYDELAQTLELSCQETTSVPVYYGNPDSVSDESVSVTTFTLTLEAGTRRFFNAQYALLSRATAYRQEISSTTRCFHDGDMVLEFDQKIVHPELYAVD
ncbi:MAG: hypothetical protein AAFP24_02410 [Pseudomonadota bacterium]